MVVFELLLADVVVPLVVREGLVVGQVERGEVSEDAKGEHPRKFCY